MWSKIYIFKKIFFLQCVIFKLGNIFSLWILEKRKKLFIQLFIYVLGFLFWQYISTASWVRVRQDYNFAAQVSDVSNRPLLLIYFCKYFFGYRYPKLFVPKNGQNLNIAAQVSDESHKPLVLISSKKNTEIYDNTSKQFFKL